MLPRASRKPLTEDVETARLRLVRWSDEYLDEFARILAQPEVVRFISGGEPFRHKEVAELSARSCQLWEEHGFGPWAAIDKATGRWVGRIGLNLLADWPGVDKWEVGFELDPAYWGKGLATEGGIRAVAVGFEIAGLKRIISVTAVEHAASRRVMEKCGLRYQGAQRFRDADVVWYAIERREWHVPP